MKNLLLHVPLPICGVALALASLGGLLRPFFEPAYPLCGVLATLLMSLVVAKYLLFPSSLKTDLEDPVLAGVAGTFPMCALMLSTYVEPFNWQFAFCLWTIGVAVHFVLIVNFIFGAFRQGWLDCLVPSCFVVLIGLVLADLTGSAYPVVGFLTALFWVELFVTFALLVAVTVRYARVPVLQESYRPLLCIYAAPPNMCLACYLSISNFPNDVLVCVLAVLSAVCYLFAFVNLFRCLPLRFYPSYAAMTFPFVISATATLKLSAHVGAVGQAGLASAAGALCSLQLLIAVLVVCYVLVRYLAFFVSLSHRN